MGDIRHRHIKRPYPDTRQGRRNLLAGNVAFADPCKYHISPATDYLSHQHLHIIIAQAIRKLLQCSSLITNSTSYNINCHVEMFNPVKNQSAKLSKISIIGRVIILFYQND